MPPGKFWSSGVLDLSVAHKSEAQSVAIPLDCDLKEAKGAIVRISMIPRGRHYGLKRVRIETFRPTKNSQRPRILCAIFDAVYTLKPKSRTVKTAQANGYPCTHRINVAHWIRNDNLRKHSWSGDLPRRVGDSKFRCIRCAKPRLTEHEAFYSCSHATARVVLDALREGNRLGFCTVQSGTVLCPFVMEPE